jgi:hypothetical protein
VSPDVFGGPAACAPHSHRIVPEGGAPSPPEVFFVSFVNFVVNLCLPMFRQCSVNVPATSARAQIADAMPTISFVNTVICARIRAFLREYHPPKMTIAINWRNLYAPAFSSLRLGVFGSERRQYWYLLIWTFFRRPAALQIAVTLAIYGHHFRKTRETMGL